MNATKEKPVARREMMVGLVLEIVTKMEFTSDASIFDALVSFSRHREISQFCRTACSLDRFYTRPSELPGEPKEGGNG